MTEPTPTPDRGDELRRRGEACAQSLHDMSVGRGAPTGKLLKHERTVRDLLALLDELRAVIERLPKTKDGVPVGPGSIVYIDLRESNRWHIFGIGAAQTEGWDTMTPVAVFRNTPDGNKPGDLETIMFDVEDCYSTRESALAASGGSDE